MADYVWVYNPQTKQEERVSYDDLDSDLYPKLIKPIGGFCYPASNFIGLSLPKVPYYVRGWLPKQGKALLYAPPKSGKSFLTYQLGRCIADGDDFLGIPTSKGRVLILQFELGEQVVQARLRSTGKSYDNVFIGTSFSMKLDSQAGQDKFIEAVASVNPDVVILDPFYKIIKGDENEAHDVTKVTDFLDEQIEAFKFSVLIIHHPGKDISKGGRGSSVLEGWVDSYLQMARTHRDDGVLRVKITPKLLRHAELPDDSIEAVFTKNFEFELGTPSLTIYQLIHNYFLGNPAKIVTIRELISENFGSRKSVNNALEKLQAASIVTKLDRGEYQLSSGVHAQANDDMLASQDKEETMGTR